MSEAMKSLKDVTNEKVHITKFSGGKDRGPCVQLTQTSDRDGAMFVQLTETQARQLVQRLNERFDWKDKTNWHREIINRTGHEEGDV